MFTFETNHTEPHCKLDLPDHTHAAHLVKAQSWTYLFFKSKSCGSCAARRAGLFSPSLECFFFSFCSLYPCSPLCLSFLFSHSVFQKSPHLLARHAGIMIILFGKNIAQTRTLDFCRWCSVLILFWEHVRVLSASAPAFAQNLAPDRGASSPTHGTAGQ